MNFFNLKKNYDFDFIGDKSNGFVPFIIGFLMYSVTVSVMSSFFTHNLTAGWKNALNGHITIEIQSNITGINEIITNKQNEEIIKIIKSTAGIKDVKKLRETDILKILEPWLSSAAIPDNFPFPMIFDVEAEKSADVDLQMLSDKLSKISPLIKIHDHANWYAPIMKISNSLFGFAIILSVLIFVTVCTTVIFITRKTLGAHLNTVKILQLIGASNSYIASQFKRFYWVISCKSTLISILCSFITIGGVVLVSSSENGMRMQDVAAYGAVMILVPLVATLLIIITSKKTVLFFLENDKWISR
jgi:cell division transport system permease protein